jgi:hypothetical protein
MSEFIPRSLQEITEAVLAYQTSDPLVAAALLPSDLNVGGLERAHVESMAMILEESDLRFALGVLRGISESCYRAFGFDYRAPQAAVGALTLSSFSPALEDINVPIGWQVMGPNGMIFETNGAGIIHAGELSSDPVGVKCLTAGVAGNVAENTVSTPVSPIAGIDIVTNPSKMHGGTDQETSDARSERFAVFLRTIVRGTKEALEFAALSASPAVADARAIEPFLLDPKPQGVPFSGVVWLFADDGIDSPTLDAGVSNEISKLVHGYIDGNGIQVPGYKAAGVKVDIVKVPRVPVCVRAAVRLKPGGVARWNVIQTALLNAADDYFERLRIGEKASYQNLVSVLSGSDPDVDEVDLVFWAEGTTPPSYAAPLMAEDLVFFDPTAALTAGSRGVLKVGVALGPDSTSVLYPEWRLG